MKITGGANIPAGGSGQGRVDAIRPLGVLTVGGGRVRPGIRTMPGFVRRLMTVELPDGTPEEIVEVVPCLGRFGTRGVGLRTVDGRHHYLWTGATAKVLDACRSEGFTVTTDVQNCDYRS